MKVSKTMPSRVEQRMAARRQTKFNGLKGAAAQKTSLPRRRPAHDRTTVTPFRITSNYRTPGGYTNWSCDVKSAVATYPSSGEIFGCFSVEALRIASRRTHQVNRIRLVKRMVDVFIGKQDLVLVEELG